MKTTGVLLVQLGTPDSPKVKDVRKYLKEFLNDPRVIDIPYLLRKLLVNLVIVPFRAPKSAKIYKELWELSGNKSPLLEHTNNLTNKLNKAFEGSEVEVHMAMRYQNPSIQSVLNTMRLKNYDHIIVLPLFPQYASASSGSAIEEVLRIIKSWWVIPKLTFVSQFWDNSGYIDSLVNNAKKFNLQDFDHILFSYHGLPERQVDKVYEGKALCTDQPCETELNEQNKFCYKATSYATTRLIAQRLNLKESDYTVCFQSRLDKKWLRPFSDEIIQELGNKGLKKILVFSPAFVADCLETVIEIGTEYQEIFESVGGLKIQLVPSCNSDDVFVKGMEQLIRAKL